MIYTQCINCWKTKPCFSNLRICVSCYQHKKYLDRRGLAVQSNPDEAAAAVAVCLRQFRYFRSAGLLTALQFAALQEQFLSLLEQFKSPLDTDEEAQLDLKAEEELAKELLSVGAVQAGSLAEATTEIEARNAALEQRWQEASQPKPVRDPAIGEALTQAAAKSRESKRSKQPFQTGVPVPADNEPNAA